ncbi:hypothetical protein ATO12_17205 [Aquimarina atlantica]|uniref:Uncharacterized protein n=1 Tax=Aquimarina atlantica TaxID=1317122 RepID=A0A023BUQ6_9FLAO|nr:hypothetical protein [Aquimarina atlantica]EZH73674.1 hypothetical protein ATO12_17205 [Aquimarina atlantica]
MKIYLITSVFIFFCFQGFSQEKENLKLEEDTVTLQLHKTYSKFEFYPKKSKESGNEFLQRMNMIMKNRSKKDGLYAIQFERVNKSDGFESAGMIVLYNKKKFYTKRKKVKIDN